MTYDKVKRAEWKRSRARIDGRKSLARTVPLSVILVLIQAPDRMGAWLESKPPQQIVGNFQTPDDTVLANFLWEELGVYAMTFGKQMIYQSDVDIKCPAWCYEYTKVEVEHYRMHSPAKGDWTASEALAILQEVQQRLQGAS